MQIQKQIILKLTEALAPDKLDVVNESHMHSVPENSQTHFKVTIVSEQFADQRKVARHQTVYRCLASELEGPVHALALHTYTPKEWQARNQAAPNSPNCLGGDKSTDK